MEDINVKELKERLEKGDKFVFLDVREEWEYDDDNLGAINIPLGELPHRLDELEDKKDQEIIIHCRSVPEVETQKNFWKVRATKRSETF